eukprot:jgi/Psemu1/65555/estExt_Genemark1.C_1340006
MVDDNGNTPLHVACQLDPPIEVLIALKEAATTTNSWEGTPLHIAASHRCNAQALKKLIDFFPGALSRLSRMHRTPIHYACMSYRGLDLVAFQVLLEETLAESHRLRVEQQQQQQQQEQHHPYHLNGHTEQNSECELKISDFIDIIQETKEDIGGDDMLDDEEVSVLINDNDSLYAIAASSSGLDSVPSLGMIGSMKADGGKQDENRSNGSNKNNYNIVTWKDTTGKTPLGLLFRRYRERVKRVIQILEELKNSGTSSPHSSSTIQTDLGHLWGKARLIVLCLSEEYHHQQQQQHQKSNQQISSSVANPLEGRPAIGTSEEHDDDSSASGQHWSLAASWSKERFSNCSKFQGRTKSKMDYDFEGTKVMHTEERRFRIVHASVGLTGYGCPPEMIRLAISIYPNQVREMDEDGNLPLHIAATASSLKSHASNNATMDEDSSVFSDSIVSLFSSASTRNNANDKSGNASFEKVIRLLLKHYPQAAQTPHGRSGRLPLVLADRAGDRTWNDGMKTLLRAYPPALFSGSKGIIPIKLYPHILSLIGGGDPPLRCKVRNAIGAQNLPNTNATLSVQRTCPSNRFKGHGGIGLLHNLLLLKQRHISQLMAGTSVIPKTNENKSNTNSIRGVDGKRRREYVTTMFELLRAKPDLIEATRSHQQTLFRKTQSAITMALELALLGYYYDNYLAPNYNNPLLGKEDKERRDCRTPRIAIKRYSQSAFMYLYQSGNNQALLNCCGVNHKVFRELLDLFKPFYNQYTIDKNTGSIRKFKQVKHVFVQRREFDATGGSAARAVAIAFGLTASPMYRWLKFGHKLLLCALQDHPAAKVCLPNKEETQQYVDAIAAKYRALGSHRVWAACDGLKLHIQQSGDWTKQNPYYNGWTIRACVLNCPGSWHDSTQADYGLYEKMQLMYQLYMVKVVVDSAFMLSTNDYLVRSSQYDPLTAPVEIPEGTPNEEATAMKQCTVCNAITVNRDATSVRQMSEWGMRQIQGGFPRLKDNMLLEETGDRRIILKLVVVLYNFQTAKVGINTILNTYMSETEGFFSYSSVPTETANDVF